MYQYDAYDRQFVQERVDQYRNQLNRFLAGKLPEEEFRPLRLQNGWYVQRHAPMLRVAIPYGVLSAPQLRALAHIAQKYDRGYGHFTTRQNIQYNWIPLDKSADVLQALADVDMHAIQTSGNCIRNITCDALAGVAADEVFDPRPFAEILRQWSSVHPEFSFLPRKFKIAMTGSPNDRAAIQIHDIGLRCVVNAAGVEGFAVYVGGGLGRTPVVAPLIRDFLPWNEVCAYIEAVVRVYNLHGRRDNIYKARIKILVRALGAEEFTRQVDETYAKIQVNAAFADRLIPAHERDRVRAHFNSNHAAVIVHHGLATEAAPLSQSETQAFAAWRGRNVTAQKSADAVAVTLSLKRVGTAQGDADTATLLGVADMADSYAGGVLRVTHMQNLVLCDVAVTALPDVWRAAKKLGLATPNIGLATDIIACPGGDFCSLANAKSIPIAAAIESIIDNQDYLHDLGDLSIKISGCMNSCGHHHIADVGILGVDKDGAEFYQISLGGKPGGVNTAVIGKILGPSLGESEIAAGVKRVLDTYIVHRLDESERLPETITRVGVAPFKAAVYENLAEKKGETVYEGAAA